MSFAWNYEHAFEVAYSENISEEEKDLVFETLGTPEGLDEPLQEALPQVGFFVDFLDSITFSEVSEATANELIDRVFAGVSEDVINEVSDEFIRRHAKSALASRKREFENRKDPIGVVGIEKGAKAEERLKRAEELSKKAPERTFKSQPSDRVKSAVQKVKDWWNKGAHGDNSPVGLSKIVDKKSEVKAEAPSPKPTEAPTPAPTPKPTEAPTPKPVKASNAEKKEAVKTAVKAAKKQGETSASKPKKTKPVAPKTPAEDKVETAKTNFRIADKISRQKSKELNQYAKDHWVEGDDDAYADAMTAKDDRDKALDAYKNAKKEEATEKAKTVKKASAKKKTESPTPKPTEAPTPAPTPKPTEAPSAEKKKAATEVVNNVKNGEKKKSGSINIREKAEYSRMKKNAEQSLKTNEDRLKALRSRPGYSAATEKEIMDSIETAKKTIQDCENVLAGAAHEALTDLAILLAKTNISESSFVEVMEMVAATKKNIEKVQAKHDDEEQKAMDALYQDVVKTGVPSPENIKKTEEVMKRAEHFKELAKNKLHGS